MHTVKYIDVKFTSAQITKIYICITEAPLELFVFLLCDHPYIIRNTQGRNQNWKEDPLLRIFVRFILFLFFSDVKFCISIISSEIDHSFNENIQKVSIGNRFEIFYSFSTKLIKFDSVPIPDFRICFSENNVSLQSSSWTNE